MLNEFYFQCRVCNSPLWISFKYTPSIYKTPLVDRIHEYLIHDLGWGMVNIYDAVTTHIDRFYVCPECYKNTESASVVDLM